MNNYITPIDVISLVSADVHLNVVVLGDGLVLVELEVVVLAGAGQGQVGRPAEHTKVLHEPRGK